MNIGHTLAAIIITGALAAAGPALAAPTVEEAPVYTAIPTDRDQRGWDKLRASLLLQPYRNRRNGLPPSLRMGERMYVPLTSGLYAEFAAAGEAGTASIGPYFRTSQVIYHIGAPAPPPWAAADEAVGAAAVSHPRGRPLLEFATAADTTLDTEIVDARVRHGRRVVGQRLLGDPLGGEETGSAHLDQPAADALVFVAVPAPDLRDSHNSPAMSDLQYRSKRLAELGARAVSELQETNATSVIPAKAGIHLHSSM